MFLDSFCILELTILHWGHRLWQFLLHLSLFWWHPRGTAWPSIIMELKDKNCLNCSLHYQRLVEFILLRKLFMWHWKELSIYYQFLLLYGALAGQQKYMDYLMGRSLPSIGVLGPFSNARLWHGNWALPPPKQRYSKCHNKQQNKKHSLQ